MIDMIGAIADTAIYAALLGVLAGRSPIGVRAKAAILAAAVLWGAVIVTVAALGGFAPGTTGPVPALALPLVGLLVLLFGAWFAFRRVRTALLSLPLPALVGVNAARLIGVFFLILTAQGRLSTPFGPAAGSGDMLVGALAIPLAVMAAGGTTGRVVWLGLWNALGAADLIVAVTLGVLSAPGTPLRLFTEGPGTLAMSGLPWIMIPTMLVPLYLFIHFTIAAKLRASPRSVAKGVA